MRYTGKRILAVMQAFIMAVMILAAAGVSELEAEAAPKEVAVPAIGIDVSSYQGLINWDMVAASGVQFAMIRVAYRAMATGVLSEDIYARYNLQEAQRVGIKVGAYVFSSAVSEAEVLEEAAFALNIISKYKITFPVAYDCEGYKSAANRHYVLDKMARTALAVRFLDTMAVNGYTPMFYSSKNDMTNSAYWDMNMLNRYKVWVAQYASQPFPITPASTYTDVHSMWQYTSEAAIAGINGAVDMNVSYFSYDSVADAKDSGGTQLITAESAANVQYTDVNEVVMANTQVNIRTAPNTDGDDTIVAPMNPGDMLYRVGIGNNGWSKILFNNEICYAYSSYLQKVA